MAPVSYGFSQCAVEGFNDIRRVNDRADFPRKLKKRDDPFPVVPPGSHNRRVFFAPSKLKFIQRI